MNHFTFSGICLFAAGLIVGLNFVFSPELKKRMYGIYWLVIGFWGFFVGFQFELLEVMPPFWWGWVLHLGCVMVPPVFLHFALVFSENPSRVKWMSIAYGLSGLYLALILFSNLFTSEIIYRDTLTYPKPSFLYPVYIVSFQVMALLGVIELWKYRERLSSSKARMWLYIFLATQVVAHIGAMDNYLIMYDIRIFPLYPYGLYAILPYALIGSAAIVKVLAAERQAA